MSVKLHIKTMNTLSATTRPTDILTDAYNLKHSQKNLYPKHTLKSTSRQTKGANYNEPLRRADPVSFATIIRPLRHKVRSLIHHLLIRGS